MQTDKSESVQTSKLIRPQNADVGCCNRGNVHAQLPLNIDMKSHRFGIIDIRHHALLKTIWPPELLSQCCDSADPIGDSDAWDLLVTMDYRPIFDTGTEVP